MAAESDYEQALRGHMLHFAGIVEREGKGLHGAGRPDGGQQQLGSMRLLQIEAENSGLALDTALRRRDEAALTKLASYLYRYYSIRGEAGLLRDQYRRLLAVVEQLAMENLSGLKLIAEAGLAAALVRLAQFDAAQAVAERIGTEARETDNKQFEALSARNLGLIQQGLGNFARAQQLHGAALELSRSAGDAYGEYASLSNLGLAAYSLGDYDAASRLLGEALAGWRRHGDLYGEASALQNLGNLEAVRRNFERAEQLFADALSLSRKLGNRAGEANALLSLGYVARGRGDFAAARERMERALGYARELGDRQMQVAVLANLASLEYDCGQIESAASILPGAIQLAAEVGHVLLLPYLCIPAAGVVAARGDASSAAALLDSALALLDRAGHLMEADDIRLVESVRARIVDGPKTALTGTSGLAELWSLEDLANRALQALRTTDQDGQIGGLWE